MHGFTLQISFNYFCMLISYTVIKVDSTQFRFVKNTHKKLQNQTMLKSIVENIILLNISISIIHFGIKKIFFGISA